jgi:hypothetical protein
MFAALGQAVLGAVAGALLAGIAVIVFASFSRTYFPEEDGYSPLLLTTGAGALLGAVMAAVAGNRELQGKAKYALVGASLGAVQSLVAVGLGFLVTAAKHPGGAKVERQVFILMYSVPVCTVLGGFVGAILARRRQD